MSSQTTATAATGASQEDISAQLQMLMDDADIWRARILMTAVQLDVFSALEQRPGDAAQLAQALDLHPEATARLLGALLEMGYVRLEGSQYRNAPVSSNFLVGGSPYQASSWFKLHDLDWPAWAGLTESIRTGRPPQQGSIFSNPERLRVLLQAAHERALLFHIHRAVADLDLRGVSTLLDVGGGAGTYSLGFCQAYPDLVCTIFDLPEAIAIARETTAAFPPGSRIRFQAGDFTRDTLGGPFDAAFMSNVLHGESPTAALALLRKVRDALNPGGRIIIRDSFLGEDGTNSMGGAVFGLTLMIETLEGRTHKLRDVREMLHAANFSRTEQPTEQFLIGWAS